MLAGHAAGMTEPGARVLVLTARDSVAARIAGLTAGGDDYVTKPFSVEEVELRLRTIMRRTGKAKRNGADSADDGTTLVYADLALDEEAREARRAGRLFDLSPTEFNLLRFLMVNAEKVVT